MRDILYIGGGFDILHSDHKKFIENGMKIFMNEFILSEIIIGLKPDLRINIQKGQNRPFFSFEWRKKDMENFLSSKKIKYRVINSLEFNPKKFEFTRIVSQVKSGYIKEGERIKNLGGQVLYVDQVDCLHTSDFEVRLIEAKERSMCNIRKVGAILIRNGKFIKDGSSGLGDCNSCKKFKAYKIGGGKKSKKISCNYPHAEDICLESAKKEDELIITDSPCMECAKNIVSKKIRRVVYLNEYHDLYPTKYLTENGVECRKSGI